MVDKPNIKENIEILGVRTREEILRVLFDGDEMSAYKIATETDMSTATIIEHLTKLEEVGIIASRDGTKGKLTRRYYKITQKGRDTLLDFLKAYATEIQKNKEIASTFSKFLGHT
jgi:predicted transcriptional regulator